MSKFALIALLFVLLGFHGIKLLVDGGIFFQPQNANMESCKNIAGIQGPEDLEYTKLWNGIFISSDERPDFPGKSEKNGAIYFLPNGEAPIAIVSNTPFSFHPHGIGIWEEDNTVYLFAVNHGSSKESTIEVFVGQTPRTLVHKNTIRHPLLVTPNDIAPIGKNQFFLSNDHGSKNHWMQLLEHLTRFGRGNLVYYDGEKMRVSREDLFFANGVTLDRQKRLLYLALMLEKVVNVYSVGTDGDLTFKHALPIPAGPDNLSLDQKGHLWIGAHPHLFKLKNHSQKHSKASPSQIFSIAEPSKPINDINLVMQDNGKTFSGVSVAVPFENSLILGTIYGKNLISCSKPVL